MPVQKYPYKVTKLDWYDYISRGEGRVVFRIKVEMPNLNIWSYEHGGDINIVAFDEKNENYYPLRVLEMENNWEDDGNGYLGINKPYMELTFAIPPTLLPGTYFIQVKTAIPDTQIIRSYPAIHTIPTNKSELKVTILDTEPMPNQKRPATEFDTLKVADLKWPEFTKEATDENN